MDTTAKGIETSALLKLNTIAVIQFPIPKINTVRL